MLDLHLDDGVVLILILAHPLGAGLADGESLVVADVGLLVQVQRYPALLVQLKIIDEAFEAFGNFINSSAVFESAIMKPKIYSIKIIFFTSD